MKKIEYPEIDFWNKKVGQLEFINSSDFRKERLLSILGVSSSPLAKDFGITDREEILRRQRLFKFFLKNPEVADMISGINLRSMDIPREGQDFLDYFRPERKHNPFWQMVEDFVEKVASCPKAPWEITALGKFLKTTKDSLETEEKEMVAEVSREIIKATYIEGMITYGFVFREDGIKLNNKNEAKVFGFKKYAYGLSNKVKEPKLLKWASENRILRSLRLGGIAEKIFNWRVKKKDELRHSNLIVEHLPESIELAIKAFIENNMRKVSQPGEIHYSGNIQIYFRYSDDGLQIQLIDANIKLERDNIRIAKLYLADKHFPGYSYRKIKQIRKGDAALNDSIEQSLTNTAKANFLALFNHRAMYGICNKLVTIADDQPYMPNVNNEFSWYSVSYLLGKSSINDSCTRIIEYRNYLRNKLEIISQIVEISTTLRLKSQKWGKGLSFPDILGETDHLIMLKNLNPIHLIGENNNEKTLTASDLVPINYLPALNGNMFVFTGQNAGGKSAAEEAIVNAIYMAQSGLPVFAEAFSLNIKNKIGMVFLERGHGSTCELLLRKTKAILESIEGASKNGVVLVLDEIGTGTQELDGFAYGKRLLKKLSDSHCSVISSTQITELACYAKKNLGAFCFNFNSEHQIKPGIGTGGINKLMVEIGIETMLN